MQRMLAATLCLAAAAAPLVAQASAAATTSSSTAGTNGAASNASSSGSGSPLFAGTITLNTDAGQGEATLLAAAEIKRAAAAIAASIVSPIKSDKATPDGTPTYLVIPGESAPDFSAWLQLHSEITLVGKQLDTAKAQADAALTPPAAPTPPARPAGGGRSHFAAALALPGAFGLVEAAQPVVTQVATFLFNDLTFGGLTLKQDDYTLAVAVSGQLRVKQPGSTIKIVGHEIGDTALSDTMVDLSNLAAKSADAQGLLARLKAQPTQTDTIKSAEASVTNASAQFNALVASLVPSSGGNAKPPATPPAAPAAPAAAPAAPAAAAAAPAQTDGSAASTPAQPAFSLSNAIVQRAIYEQLSKGADAIYLKVESTTGGYYTRRNVWTSLGLTGVPFFVSGGAVISWAQTNGGGDFKVGNVCALASSYEKVTRTDTRIAEAQKPSGAPCD